MTKKHRTTPKFTSTRERNAYRDREQQKTHTVPTGNSKNHSININREQQLDSKKHSCRYLRETVVAKVNARGNYGFKVN